MKSRCNNPNYRNSQYWRGNGITYPIAWEKFTVFLKDMGERPDNTTLDRIDNTKPYSKENCRWATRQEQMNNVSNNHHLSYLGKTKTLTEWARITGIKQTTIRLRLKRGWSIEKALTTDV